MRFKRRSINDEFRKKFLFPVEGCAFLMVRIQVIHISF